MNFGLILFWFVSGLLMVIEGMKDKKKVSQIVIKATSWFLLVIWTLWIAGWNL